MSGRPPLLLVDPGPPRKKWLLERFLRQPVELFVLTDPDDRWPDALLPPERIIQAPLATKASAEAIATMLAQAAPRFAGVGTCYERSVTLAADLAERWGLPGPSAAAARRSSASKIAMRETLARAGVQATRFAIAADPAGLPAAVAEIGFPCVIKPASGADSAGVRKLCDADDLVAALRDARALDADRRAAGAAIFDPRWMVEEFLSGPLVSIDGIVRHGEATVFGVTETELGPEPWFTIEVNRMPPRLSATSVAALEAAAIAAVRALGFVTCGFHAELRLTPAGPRLIEVAARVAGGEMPKGYFHRHGIDMAAAMTALWLGQAPDLTPRWSRFVLQEGVFPRGDGTLGAIDGIERARAVAGLFDLAQICRPGDRILAGSAAARPIYYFAIEAESRAALEQRRAEIHAAIQWRLG